MTKQQPCLQSENEQLRAGYDAARLEIESLRERVQQGQLARDVNSRRVTELEAQLAAVGAGGVEPLRKRCLHQIIEPQAQPVGAVPVAWRYQTPTGWHATTDASAALRVRHHHEVEPLYAAPQPAAQALECGNCFEGETDRGHACRKCGGTGVAQALDAERWQFFAEYLVSTRTDLDDEIVGCDSVQKMARVLDAARAAQEGKHD